ncbi:cupin domain-containing protein [Candidatus Woesearchaeota archaeon]|nr:cupin domain-containing protein [Candidatus Woesearchaeota archaeon]
MNIDKNIQDMIEYPKEGVLSKEVYRDDTFNTDLFCMAAGKEISEHTSTKKAIVYVVDGKGVFNLEGQDIIMEPGKLIHMDANAKHSLKAESNTSFLLILSTKT